MSYLVVDIGNTMCKAALFTQSGEMEAVARAKRVVNFREFLQGVDVRKAIVCAVGVEPSEVVQQIAEVVDVEVEVLDHKRALPVKNMYKTPHTLGMDRLAAAVGAQAAHPNEDLLIVDFGTAITIDHLTAEGEFCGGNISAGLLTRLSALHAKTQLLPEITPATLDELKSSYTKGKIGATTIEALFYGAADGIRYEIEGYFRENSSKKIIFSGGDAFFFEKILNFPIFAINDLTLRGLYEMIK